MPSMRAEVQPLNSNTDDLITEAIIRLLENGVPTKPISIAFDIDQATVKNIQATLRIKHYGASEIAELLQNLMFDAYAQARHQMQFGSPTAKQAMIRMVLSRAMALVGKQSPEEFERLRREMVGLMADITTKTGVPPSMYADPTYSPVGEDLAEAET